MLQPTRFNFIDVLWAPYNALSAKKITAMTIFLLQALAVYNLFVYIALAVQGESLAYIFSVHGFFYFSLTAFTTAPALAVFAVGVAAALLLVMLGLFAVSAMEIEEVRGNRFFSLEQAIKFAYRRAGQIFLSEFSIVLFLAFVVLLFFLFGLLTRIPFLGEWLLTILFVLPSFVVAFLVVMIFGILVVSFVLLPAVASAERQGETFASILETFSTVIRQPVRWLSYTFYAVIAAKFCGFVYAYFCYRAVQFSVWATGLGGGEKIRQTVASGLSHLPYRSDVADATLNVFPGIDWGFSVVRWARGGGDDAVGYLMAVMLFVIFASIIGYMLAVVASAQARGFVAIRYIKDNYNISEEDSLFFVDEHVNPPIEDEEG